MQRRATIRDVAAAARVSTATVSYALNGSGRVSVSVEARVREAALALAYTPSRSARALRTGRSGVLACVVPTLASPVFPEIARAVQAGAAERGLAMVLVDAGSEPTEEVAALELLARQGVEGAVAVLSPDLRAADLPVLPLVTLDSPVAGLPCVRCDHRRGGALAARHLLVRGHRRVGLLTGDPRLFSSRERRAGFLEAAAGGMDVVWEQEVALAPELPGTATRLLAARNVTAVACVNDVVAIGVLGSLRDLGLAVPGDVAVIGFDDMRMSGWPLVSLTTVRQPIPLLARTAVDLLLSRRGQRRCEFIGNVELVERRSA